MLSLARQDTVDGANGGIFLLLRSQRCHIKNGETLTAQGF